MWTIALETSTRNASVALQSPEGEIVHRALPNSVRTAVGLIPLLRDMLREQQLAPSDLDIVAVGIGPGSFTGLRIGVTAAKTLAFAVDARLVGINSLAVLAHQTAPRPGRLWTFIDGQRGDLVGTAWRYGEEPNSDETNKYRQSPDRNSLDRQWHSLYSSARLLPRREWSELLAPGDTIIACELRHPFVAPKGIHVMSGSGCVPQATAVAQLAASHINLNQPVRETWNIRPEYYRPSAAEEHRAVKR